jgi:hypothetical protein
MLHARTLHGKNPSLAELPMSSGMEAAALPPSSTEMPDVCTVIGQKFESIAG